MCVLPWAATCWIYLVTPVFLTWDIQGENFHSGRTGFAETSNSLGTAKKTGIIGSSWPQSCRVYVRFSWFGSKSGKAYSSHHGYHHRRGMTIFSAILPHLRGLCGTSCLAIKSPLQIGKRPSSVPLQPPFACLHLPLHIKACDQCMQAGCTQHRSLNT